MGTNFHWADKPATEEEMDPEWHIGKKSGAGLYCWTCREGLAGRPACPRCGAPAPSYENTPRPETPPAAGIAWACAFTWCQEPRGVKARCQVEPGVIIVDEYGDTYTGERFLQMLAWCPLESKHIGGWFS